MVRATPTLSKHLAAAAFFQSAPQSQAAHHAHSHDEHPSGERGARDVSEACTHSPSSHGGASFVPSATKKQTWPVLFSSTNTKMPDITQSETQPEGRRRRLGNKESKQIAVLVNIRSN
jgi:hypothetical protein